MLHQFFLYFFIYFSCLCLSSLSVFWYHFFLVFFLFCLPFSDIFWHWFFCVYLCILSRFLFFFVYLFRHSILVSIFLYSFAHSFLFLFFFFAFFGYFLILIFSSLLFFIFSLLSIFDISIIHNYFLMLIVLHVFHLDQHFSMYLQLVFSHELTFNSIIMSYHSNNYSVIKIDRCLSHIMTATKYFWLKF